MHIPVVLSATEAIHIDTMFLALELTCPDNLFSYFAFDDLSKSCQQVLIICYMLLRRYSIELLLCGLLKAANYASA